MTSIKPPAAGPTGTPSAASPAAAESNANSPFANALDTARTAQSASTHQTGETPALPELAAQRGSDPVAGLLKEMEAGRLGMDQAVDQLVGHALESVGKQLSAAERAELTGMLRDALAHDPTLLALRDERG
jgi:hypothetical protein